MKKIRARNIIPLISATLLLFTLLSPLTTSIFLRNTSAAEYGDATSFLTIQGIEFGGDPAMNPATRQLKTEAQKAYCVGYTTKTAVTPGLLSRAIYGNDRNGNDFTYALNSLIRPLLGDNWSPNDLTDRQFQQAGGVGQLMSWSYLLTNKYNPGGISQSFESDDSARMIGYMLKLLQTQEQVPIIGLWRATESPGTSGACGNPHPGTPNADLGGAHMIMIPVRGKGGALSNPDMWKGAVARNVGSPSGSGSDNFFSSFEMVNVGQSGMTGKMQAVQINDSGFISVNSLPDQVLISNGGSGGAGGQPDTPTHTGRTIKASFINAATIQLEYDMDGKHVVEKYVDRKWDSLSFYFLTETSGHPDPNRSSYTWSARAGEAGIASNIDPFCDPKYTQTDIGVPFVALPSNFPDVGGGGGNQHCDDYARGLIDISYDDGDGTTPLQEKTDNLGQPHDGRIPRFFDYPFSPVDWGYETKMWGISDSPANPNLPLGEDLTGPTNTLEQSIWFYVVAEKNLEPAQWEALSVWQEADSTQAHFTVGAYAYNVPGSIFQHAGGDCTNSTLSPAGMSTSDPQNYLAGNPPAWVLDWKLADKSCTNPAWRQATVIGKVITQAELDGVITAPEDTGGVVEGDVCTQKSGVFGWVICPSTTLFADMASGIDEILLGFLKIKVDTIFSTNADSNYFRVAWVLFRNIAYALLVILGLIMVVSQVAGLDLFDAYTIKKMLPKLVAAAIIIPLLWPSLEVITRMANDSALAIEQLIIGPFNVGETSTVVDILTSLGLVSGGVIAAGAFIALGGGGVILALVGSLALAILQAVVVIAARNIVFYILIIASPVAIVLAIFEPFKKGFDMWRRLLTGILLSIPAVAAVLAGAKVGAVVSRQTSSFGVFFEITFMVVGYLMFWPILKSMDKVAGQIDSMADKVTSGAQKALAKYRGETMKRRWSEFRNNQRGDLDTQGFRWKGVGWKTRAGSLFNPSRMLRSAARQANILEAAAQPGVGYKDARHGAAHRAHEFRNAQRLLEEAQKHGEATSGNSPLNQAIAEAGRRRDGESKEQYHARVISIMAGYARARHVRGAQEKHIKEARERHVSEARDRAAATGESFGEAEQAAAEVEFDRTKREAAEAEFDRTKKEAVEAEFNGSQEKRDLDVESAKAIKQAESDYKVEAGSSTFHLIGLMASAGDNTAWRTGDFAGEGEARERLAAAVASAVDDHTIDEVMGAKILTSNKGRLDLSGGGFGAAMGYVKGARRASVEAGASKYLAEIKAKNPDMSEADAQKAAIAEYRRREAASYDAAIRRGNSAQQLYAQRHETAKTQAEKDMDNLALLSDAAQVASLDPAALTPGHVEELRKIAVHYGLDPGGAPAELHSRVQAHMDAERALRDLVVDKTGRPLSVEEAMTRQFAQISSAYQYAIHFAPQNEQFLSDILLRSRLRLPVMTDTGEPELEADGVTPKVVRVRVPTGATETVRDPSGRTEEVVVYDAAGRPTRERRPVMITQPILVIDPDDPTGTRTIPQYREEVRPVTRKAMLPKEMTVADALEAVKNDPELAKVWKLHGFDPYALGARTATGTAPPTSPEDLVRPLPPL